MVTCRTMRVIVVVLAAVVGVVYGAHCHGQPNPNAPQNLLPVNTGEPELVATHANGKLFRAGTSEGSFYVLHLWGTPYECGVAQGTLLKDEVKAFVNGVYAYIEDQIDLALNSTKPGHYVPHWLLNDIAEFGIDAALDLEIAATRPWTPAYFLEEIKGLADATGLSYLAIERVHLLGELTKGGCSLLSAYDSAITSEYSLLGVRALDWNTDAVFVDHAQVTVYHPSGDWGKQGPGHAFANVGFSGFIGSFNGVSAANTYSQEIGVTFPDETFGKESRFGIPFTYLLRDLIQFDETIEQAETRVRDAKRTCDLILGFGHLGDSDGEPFRAIQYSASVANFFNSTTLMPLTSWHPRMEDLVYYEGDWLCEQGDVVMHRQLAYAHGELSPELVIKNITSVVATGDTFTSVYGFRHDGQHALYQAFARSSSESGPDPAYLRQFTKLDLADLWAEAKPTL
ncbi:uncharacterized protein AMSG_08947 [Thecamonas trahens ATCC 50062]|uniref:Uncharacterized protein n=1 Tax=Thecamonas trahens ATCC 50062 TaxID=461836 RepID=A0A0L0DME2_THETB|nr:hypothetical protein AMSG_08947 [Thecamonas trahens ATCC 50062]KNC53440.1 hypothetical protein AMSG_08947 [Thecamonas trahens ATCC 50062]|eukprot:XP_013754475.1 hypothetical protein AMSG_08947 [Thecamonas trahens ATCC 50062]